MQMIVTDPGSISVLNNLVLVNLGHENAAFSHWQPIDPEIQTFLVKAFFLIWGTVSGKLDHDLNCLYEIFPVVGKDFLFEVFPVSVDLTCRFSTGNQGFILG